MTLSKNFRKLKKSLKNGKSWHGGMIPIISQMGKLKLSV